MSLKDAEKRLEQTATCKVVAFVEALNKEDLATFAAWIVGKKPAGWIARVVAADGKLVNEKTLKRHLDGNCQCPAETLHKGAYRVAK